MSEITYSVWPVAPSDDAADGEHLTRDEAIGRYGLPVIEAAESILAYHPGKTLGLHGRREELLIEFAEAKTQKKTQNTGGDR